MADQPRTPQAMDGQVVARLVKETGITELEARELVALLGNYNWASLVREARLLMRKV